jgi:hypothetical protein
MIWTEVLFSRFPVKKILWQQMFVRLAFLFLIWLTGLIVYTFDGFMMQYLSTIQFYSTLFGSNFIILFGSYMMQRSLHGVILSFRPLLKLDESKFQRFMGRIERYSYSFIPCLLIGLFLIIFSGSTLIEFQEVIFNLHKIWNLFFIIFVNLLSGTGTWFVISIWLSIFMISRQPLDLELSSDIIKKFRGLTKFILYFSLFYFLTISIGLFITLVGSPASSLIEFVFSPTIIFIAIGIVSILFPFYNIHKTLLDLKNRELRNIQEEFERLRKKLDEVLGMESNKQSNNQILAIIGRIFSLQMKEKSVNTAPEWPFDVGFISKILGLVLIPAVVRIFIEIFNRFVL